MATDVEPRVSNLERIVEKIAYAQLRNEEAIFQLTEDTADFKREMAEFKDEMAEFKDESRRMTRDMNRKWGELANRLGTIVEDIVLPNMPGIMREHFGVEEPEFIAVRIKRVHPEDRSRRREFDLIATSGDRLFLNETKATVKREYITAFAEGKEEVFEFFPEYRGKTLVPIFSSLYLTADEVAYLTKLGIYGAMLSDDAMDIVNYNEVSNVGSR